MIYLYGASGHGKVVLEIAEVLGIPIAGLIDANPLIRSLLDYPVTTDLPDDMTAPLILSIGSNRIRKKLAYELKGRCFKSLIHPGANISKRSAIRDGSVIMAGVAVNSGASVGEHCIINTNASVDHDCNIADFVHISPNVALAGDVTIGEGTHVGIGASVIQGINIGKWCTIGAGAVIIRDVPDGATVVGNPGRVIKITETSIK